MGLDNYELKFIIIHWPQRKQFNFILKWAMPVSKEIGFHSFKCKSYHFTTHKLVMFFPNNDWFSVPEHLLKCGFRLDFVRCLQGIRCIDYGDLWSLFHTCMSRLQFTLNCHSPSVNKITSSLKPALLWFWTWLFLLFMEKRKHRKFFHCSMHVWEGYSLLIWNCVFSWSCS